MTPVRIKTGINKAEDAHRVRRCVAASLSDDGGQLSRISWLDPPGDPMRPNVDNICLRQCAIRVCKSSFDYVASYPFFCWTQIRTTGTLIDCRRPKV